ncbi:Zn-binding Pro-Ala-Ala-Arg (PAAR) domain-containing protein, incolved in TypeVI secretion [Micromonospora pallida]|uniref:Zn-binding Pro-Ala-Ala-Arg (PAAR) domain-containing protein, incolved in TypeVI secretion n=1 Tax=Micromonospora pallida TaxID=145854 RepID=A0A1C6SZZ6_9ACTN|nr:PAAR domain-containing protein [Micromonospora pallida]SCL35140.1 Zn-binding Pro-Ala-Ala-Arg (PAAR) domain-containing protein, incolved in TypeVI secretion [Micromonospora pallida]
MGVPAAKLGDKVVGNDTHIIMVPSPGGPVPTPTPMPFAGTITTGCSTDVLIEGKPAAVVGSGAVNSPPHVPTGGPFQVPPTNQGTVLAGSPTVLINGKPAARHGDKVNTCNDPAPLPNGTIVATGQVIVA